MPVYEYVCKDCARPFEELVRADELVPCPACGSSSVEKQLSAFATSREGATRALPEVGGCGTCGDPRGPGACASE